MRRRLLIGLLSGVLVGALLPGVAAAKGKDKVDGWMSWTSPQVSRIEFSVKQNGDGTATGTLVSRNDYNPDYVGVAKIDCLYIDDSDPSLAVMTGVWTNLEEPMYAFVKEGGPGEPDMWWSRPTLFQRNCVDDYDRLLGFFDAFGYAAESSKVSVKHR